MLAAGAAGGLQESPLRLLRDGKVVAGTGGKPIKVLLGSNADEGSTFVQASVRDEADLATWCNYTFGTAIAGRPANMEPEVPCLSSAAPSYP